MNIVFDLGGVVFNWQPQEIIRRVFDDVKTQELVAAEIFEHVDWAELDRGTLGLDRAIARGAERTGLPHADIERLLNEVPGSLTPKHETIDLIRSIAGTENRLLVLSNMHIVSIEHLEKAYDIWDMFDGIVISSRIQTIKPEIEIYEHLLNKHELIASETVFIDDTRENLVAANSIGIQTIQFVSADQCRQELVELKCI